MRSVLTLLAVLPTLAHSQQPEGVIARCGASSGHSYFFETEPDQAAPVWEADRIAQGKIVLVRLGDEWDIQFDDYVGSYSYRQDGAVVMPLLESGNLLTVGVFNNDYVDVYTFDLASRTVGWSSNKHGPFLPKVSAFAAACD